MTKKEELARLCNMIGIYYRTYSPGDGVTRYRFFKSPGNGYFGPDSGLYTALGIRDAFVYALGYYSGCAVSQLQWTTEIPTETGCYWFKPIKFEAHPKITEVNEWDFERVELLELEQGFEIWDRTIKQHVPAVDYMFCKIPLPGEPIL